MRCFIDGDQLVLTKDNFINLQESSDVLFVDTNELRRINRNYISNC